MHAFRSMQLPLGLIIIGLLFTLTILYMSIPKSWEEATQTGSDGSISLSDDWSRTIERKKSKYEIHELYMLVATRNGNFLCKHCPTGSFYLNTGEVYRYGTTGNHKGGRGYTDLWLAESNLTFVNIMIADLTTVKIAEANLIGTYTLHPENLKRPILNAPKSKLYWYRLVIPPGNNRLD